MPRLRLRRSLRQARASPRNLQRAKAENPKGKA
jgi:hypothetical protein